MPDRKLTPESFDLFLDWLNPDREKAEREYKAICCRLIAFFDCRRCAASEDLADETIHRVILNIHSFVDSYKGEPARLLYGFAHKVYLEYLQKHVKRDGGPVPETMPAPMEEEEKELRLACLDQCLEKLPPNDREMVLQYYQEDRRAKVDHRERLAERFGYPTTNALRIKMSRLRGKLYDCIMSCLGLGATE